MIIYGRSEPVWENFDERVRKFVKEHNIKSVCDVGGGANPILPVELVNELGVRYTVMDISSQELSKAPKEYSKVQQDICSKDLTHLGEYDLVLTKMLAEHIRNGKRLHVNIFQLLNPGGYAIHFYPTLYAFPFIVNRLLPERLTSWILNLVAPRDRFRHEKFPAYYSWCRGPTRRQQKLFEKVGYSVTQYEGLFGHAGYYEKFRVLSRAHEMLVNFLLRHPNSYLTSYAYLVLKKS